ncbi:uncharacterized protein LOC132714650, partial [Ruditapes philippinarum]|uniref:uncharacterized protein LOC132714650 n=1 Tax=Ruditapes philippinarum TaxID=129788 RepID=UPI00295C04B9
VSVQFNTTILEPKEGLRMDIRADPNSTVYVMIEDKRSRLLGTGNDVFDNEIVSMVENIASYDDDVVMLSDIPIFTETNVMDLLMFNTSLPKQCFHITTPPPQYFPTWIPGMVPTPAPGKAVHV